eukprot:8158893-Alexandrium_andersonii.AAC.1
MPPWRRGRAWPHSLPQGWTLAARWGSGRVKLQPGDDWFWPLPPAELYASAWAPSGWNSFSHRRRGCAWRPLAASW